MLADERVDVLSDSALEIQPEPLFSCSCLCPDQCNAPNPSLVPIVPEHFGSHSESAFGGIFGGTFGGTFTGAHLGFLLMSSEHCENSVFLGLLSAGNVKHISFYFHPEP